MNEKSVGSSEKIKNHFRKHKVAYISVGVSVTAGVAVGLLVGRGQVSISNPAMVNYKPVANTVQVQMVRPGPKSFVVQCVESGQVWPSIRQAAESTKLSPGLISGHLKGKFADVGGFHFIKLDEI